MANGENSRLCEMARLAFSSVSLRLFEFLDCETEIKIPKWLCKNIETVRCTEPLKKQDCETRKI